MNQQDARDLSEFVEWVREKSPIKLPEECHVKDCHERDIEAVDLLPFDPIDHTGQTSKLCAEHREWAAERNALAEEMHARIERCQAETDQTAVECRKQVGMEHIDRIKELTVPQGTMREDVLDGSIKDKRSGITLEEALE